MNTLNLHRSTRNNVTLKATKYKYTQEHHSWLEISSIIRDFNCQMIQVRDYIPKQQILLSQCANIKNMINSPLYNENGTPKNQYNVLCRWLSLALISTAHFLSPDDCSPNNT